ncbi:MAG: peroxiredoxin [Bacteroidia bacterium]|nr:peroxiredoxin [Bacteroidia bacterium]
MNRPQIGTAAPHFSLPNQDGEIVNITDFIGKKHVVLYFYPKDETPGCTKEACGFRDSYEDFVAAGAEVIGVSADSIKSHQQFASSRRLPFHLLSDPNSKAADSYGVKKSLFGLLPGRETFLIDKDGIVRYHFASQLQIGPHISEALMLLRSWENG